MDWQLQTFTLCDEAAMDTLRQDPELSQRVAFFEHDGSAQVRLGGLHTQGGRHCWVGRWADAVGWAACGGHAGQAGGTQGAAGCGSAPSCMMRRKK